MPNQNDLKKRVYNFYNLNKNEGNLFIRNHFLAEGFNQQTIYRFIKDAKNGVPLGRKKESGRKATINNAINKERVKRFFDHKRGVSQRQVASKLNCSPKKIRNILKSLKKPIKCFKRIQKPKRTLMQKAFAQPKCGRMYRKYRQHEFVMDDESYWSSLHCAE